MKTELHIQIIEDIIIDLVYSDKRMKQNLSDVIREKMQHHYTYLANIYSRTQGRTIQQFFIETKIERSKLLMLSGMQIQDVAFKLHYSSNGHFSNQFKAIAGITPTQYKKQNIKANGK